LLPVIEGLLPGLGLTLALRLLRLLVGVQQEPPYNYCEINELFHGKLIS
jgi:hypothetical protein